MKIDSNEINNNNKNANTTIITTPSVASASVSSPSPSQNNNKKIGKVAQYQAMLEEKKKRTSSFTKFTTYITKFT